MRPCCAAPSSAPPRPVRDRQRQERPIQKRIEQRAKAAGLDSIFVLTTRTMHWFIKRGFAQVEPEWLPEARRRMYNWDRKSQVLVKKLG
jgi:amino-acid N-acetyltransferase